MSHILQEIEIEDALFFVHIRNELLAIIAGKKSSIESGQHKYLFGILEVGIFFVCFDKLLDEPDLIYFVCYVLHIPIFDIRLSIVKSLPKISDCRSPSWPHRALFSCIFFVRRFFDFLAGHLFHSLFPMIQGSCTEVIYKSIYSHRDPSLLFELRSMSVLCQQIIQKTSLPGLLGI